MASEESALERKRKRLEAWRKRQQLQQSLVEPASNQPIVKVSLSLGSSANLKLKNVKEPTRKSPPSNPFGDVDDDEDNGEDSKSGDEGREKNKHLFLGLGLNLMDKDTGSSSIEPPKKRQRNGRWDAAPNIVEIPDTNSTRDSSENKATVSDALDNFMDKLQAGAMGNVTTQISAGGADLLTVDVGGSLMRVPKLSNQSMPSPVSGGIITSAQLAKLTAASHAPASKVSQNEKANADALYTPSDWESDTQSVVGGGSETEDDEEEEKARRAFIEALKSAPGPESASQMDDEPVRKPSLAAEVKSEKDRRERVLRDLERNAEEARALAEKSAAPEFGVLYNDAEGGVMVSVSEERRAAAFTF